MVIKIRCSDTVGSLIIKFFSLLLTLTGDEHPEDLQFETLDDTSDRLRSGGARMKYWAKLPTKVEDGKEVFDLALVAEVIKANLHSLGATTVNGIIYSDIAELTLQGEDPITERRLRDARMMKAGSSQRAIVQLNAMGLIDKGPIEHSTGQADNDK